VFLLQSEATECYTGVYEWVLRDKTEKKVYINVCPEIGGCEFN
jgi:hypothetical protein